MLSGALDDVPRARRFVRDALHAWACSDVDGDVELVTSELVGNAIMHASPPFDLVVHNLTVAVRIEVWDSSPDLLPVRRGTGPDASAGLGIRLTDELSESWGVEFSPDGTRKGVWVELTVTPAVVRVAPHGLPDAVHPDA